MDDSSSQSENQVKKSPLVFGELASSVVETPAPFPFQVHSELVEDEDQEAAVHGWIQIEKRADCGKWLLCIPAKTDGKSDLSFEDSVALNSSVPESVPVVKKPPVSWAALVRHTPPTSATSLAESAKVSSSSTTETKTDGQVSTVSPTSTPCPWWLDFPLHLSSSTLASDHPLLKPRGLMNRGNMCFMNAVLQTLLLCRPFYQMMMLTARHWPLKLGGGSHTPLLDAMIMFCQEFLMEDDVESTATDGTSTTTPSSSPQKDPKLLYDPPFFAEYIYNALLKDQRFLSVAGQQEDAEEFLCFLLDGLHEEFVGHVLKKFTEEQTSEVDGAEDMADGTDEGDWLEVGPKKKETLMRRVDTTDSPISRIFRGHLRSVISAHGMRDSVTVQPYHALPLDITHSSIHTLDDALWHLTHPEHLEQYHHPHQPGRIMPDAVKRMQLESVPPVLIVQLKRFVFRDGAVQKLHKFVAFGHVLTVPGSLFGPAGRRRNVQYQLIGVVDHHGANALDGHYTCDVRRGNGSWIHIDDTLIFPVSEAEVTEYHPDREAYILFYHCLSGQD